MKATSLTSIALVLLSAPAFAGHAHHAKHSAHPTRTPTAMHTTQVHHRDASQTARHEEKAEQQPEDREQQQLQQRVRARGAAVAAAKKAEKAKPPCLHEPIAIGRGTEEERFALTRCDGSALPDAVDHLTVLARPESIAKPAHGAPIAAGMRRLDARLVERLQLVADHFKAHGAPQISMHIVSGYRPTSVGSFHASAQALDFRVDGIKNEELVAFCKTLQDTGCGYYPNSSFVHMDVRAPGTGHVAWIDASGPGESAHYVAAWPPPPEPVSQDFAEKLAKILPPLPVDMHPGEVAREIIDADDHAQQASLDKPSKVH
jgi:hypothetical protein